MAIQGTEIFWDSTKYTLISLSWYNSDSFYVVYNRMFSITLLSLALNYKQMYSLLSEARACLDTAA